MKPEHAKRLEIGDCITRIRDSAHPTLCARGEVVDRTTQSVSVQWDDFKRPWQVFYFDDAHAIEPLVLDTIPRT